MATVNETTEKKVKIKIPKSRNDKSDIWVCVNGHSYLIKRGEEVEVPVSVKEVLDHREEMLTLAEEYEESVKSK